MSSNEQIESIRIQRQQVQYAQQMTNEKIKQATVKLRAVVNVLQRDPLNLCLVDDEGLRTSNGDSFSADQFVQLTATIKLYKDNAEKIESLTTELRRLGCDE